MSDGEDLLAGQLRALSLSAHPLPMPEPQYRGIPGRRFRFDFAWPARLLAVEVDGGTWTGGRHTRGKGYEGDCEKANEAICLGWRVLRVTTAQVSSGQALAWIERLLR
jgi:very-short-patch-repair endonuclease